MVKKYFCILVIEWPRPKQFAKNLLMLKTFNCFAALRKLREFDAKQPFNEEETRGMCYCCFLLTDILFKGKIYRRMLITWIIFFQHYTAWRSTILDGYTTKTKDQVSRMSRGFLSYFTKRVRTPLNRHVRHVSSAQGAVLQIMIEDHFKFLFENWLAIFFHSVRQKILGTRRVGSPGVSFMEALGLG